MKRENFLAIVLLATLLALMSVPAMAQQWPARTIRAVVPLTAGSAVDIVPRIVLEQVAAQIGQSIVVENRTGASGTIGIRSVTTSPPDGYTLLAHSSGIVVSPFTVANAHYDPIKDFVAVAPLANLPNVLVVAPSQNIRTVQDFVANAKKQRITYGSAGVGTPVYLAMEKFRLAAGFQGDFIPFRGAPEVLTEVITGRVDAYYAPLSAALEFIRTGKLVALSVSSVQRSSALPDIPTSIPFRPEFLDRHLRTGWDPARHRRQAQPRDRDRARRSGCTREARQPGRRSNDDGRRRIPDVRLRRIGVDGGTREGVESQAAVRSSA
jgi:tripartite-type tricarboxylate transporter receptor subunit TctC